MSDKEFDIDSFNKEFENQSKKRKEDMRKKMQAKIDELSKRDEPIPIHKRSIGEIMISTKDAMFGILEDLLQNKFNKETFTKENRLFYLGVFILMLTVLMILYSLLFPSEPKKSKDEGSIKIHHIHKIIKNVLDNDNSSKSNTKTNTNKKD